MSVEGLAEVASGWDAEVERLTAPYRERRARHLTSEGHRRRREWSEKCEAAQELERTLEREEGGWRGVGEDGRELFVPHVDVKYGPMRHTANDTHHGRWHYARAKGQRERFERMRKCQTTQEVEVRCVCCERSAVRLSRCRAALVCVSCRGRVAWEKIQKLEKARKAALTVCRRLGLLNPHRKGGRWTEKLCTLTIPHLPELAVRARIDFARAGWRIFSKAWGRWMKKHERGGVMRWARNAEWEPGDDDLGHPHFHFWFLGTFIPGASELAARRGEKSPLRDLWRKSLKKAARTLPDDARAAVLAALEDAAPLVVDVRVVRDGPGAMREIIKYLYKDFAGAKSGGRRRVLPSIWAEVFEAFDGSRITQTSRGLMSLAQALAGEGKREGAKCIGCRASTWRITRRWLNHEMSEILAATSPHRRRHVHAAKSAPPPMAAGAEAVA